MRTGTDLSRKQNGQVRRRHLQSIILLMSMVSLLWCPAFAMEPIGTLGHPFVKEHVFLPDGTLGRSFYSSADIVDPETGDVIAEFNDGETGGLPVFSETGTHLAILDLSAGGQTTVHIWDTVTREAIAVWNADMEITAPVFSPVAPIFAEAKQEGVYLWNWETGTLLTKIELEKLRWAPDVIFHPNGRHIILLTNRREIKLWNLDTGEIEGELERTNGHDIVHFTLSPDGTRFALSYRGLSLISVWNVETRELLWETESGIGRVSDIVFSPNSERLFVATQTGALLKTNNLPWQGWDDLVRVWDTDTGMYIDTFGTEFRRLREMKLSHDGERALLYYYDAAVLWNIREREILQTWVDFMGPWWGLDIIVSPDGKTVLHRSRDYIKTWDVLSGEMRLLLPAGREMFHTFAVSPDSQKFALTKGWVEVRDLRTVGVEVVFDTRVSSNDQLAFSPDGRWLAADNGTDDVFIFDLENRTEFQRIRDTSLLRYYDLVFSENGEYLAGSGQGQDTRGILVWKLGRESFVMQYRWEVPGLYLTDRSTLAFVSDQTLAVSTRDGIQIWTLLPDGPELSATLGSGISRGDAPLSATRDGRYLFANPDRHLEIWDWREQTRTEYPNIVSYFATSGDSSVLFSDANVGEVEVWDGTALLPIHPVAVLPQDKQLTTFGVVKRNALLQNFPNPFNPETWIPFRLANENAVTIHIHSTTGHPVRKLSLSTLPAGDYSEPAAAAYWNGRNRLGEPVSSGVYLYTITAGDFTATRKMLIQK